MAVKPETKEVRKLCGVVMPISECDGCGPTHWQDVLSIVISSATEAGFLTRLVSDTMESNLIHTEILANIFNDDIVIVDVSGRNPNVFFELGVRMATQKPTVIIKDNCTSYPFDTGPNRFVEYPRDLRHPAMEMFKDNLKRSLERTVEHSADKSFIGQLGPFQVPKIEAKEVSMNDALMRKLESIEHRLRLASPILRESDGVVGQVISLKYPNMRAERYSHSEARLFLRDIDVAQVKNGMEQFVRVANDDSHVEIIRLTSQETIVGLKVLRPSILNDRVRQLSFEINDAIPF